MHSIVQGLKYILVVFSLLIMVSCGGGSGPTTPPTPTTNRIFVFDSMTNAIQSLGNANPGQGVFTPDRTIIGSGTGLVQVDDFVLDSQNNRLYASNISSILVFDNVSNATGNISPARVITSSSFGTISHLFLDKDNDVMYASDDLQGIWMIHNISTRNGNLTPSRKLTGDFGSTSYSIEGITVDTSRDILYVAIRVGGLEKILAYNSASTINGDKLTANREFTSNNTGGNPGQLALDATNDRLYMADSGSYAVRVFDSVSSLNGTVDPNRTIRLSASITDVKVDVANNRLYAINPSLIYIVSGASSANGTIAGTQLQGVDISTTFNAIVVAP